ncbi:efflux RND transporter periplasmic adaptor subunit [Jannaschia sp. W003]|uniref:efflux RND transporter periplasmic adaptor subunit n=1 Tax=Jannaschia sp. W003 TaxID=2867012 RepID=UPI0021A59641|nr:efflux RND transporter periplasmic adaptor subunit [Jannaschia sp. W003]UWQ23123.1 efflux RND transporter periplasmic adaptor subunit [Jannaschia sp. W003]
MTDDPNAASASDTVAATPAPEPLRFDTDRGAWRARAIAAALVVLLAGWMGSGYVLPSEEAAEGAPTRAEAVPVTVAVRPSTAEPVRLFLAAEGQARPERTVQVPAETSGTVAEVRVAKGEDVEAGAVIAVIDAAQRVAELRRAQADEARTQREFDNATTLLGRGAGTVDRVAQAEAALASARAALAAAEEQIASTEIVAPFAGRIEGLDARVGEFVQAGAAVATLVDATPLTVEIRVPQQALASLEVGLPAEVAFITGQTREGTLSFLGTAADAETRTFLGEVSVPNPGGLIPAGISAEVRIPTGLRVAHLVSPAILSLGDDGGLGIKTLREGDVVAFDPIEIVRAESGGLWVTGLPDQATIVTVGQGFVTAGERVTPRAEGELLAETGAGTPPEAAPDPAAPGAMEGIPPAADAQEAPDAAAPAVPEPAAPEMSEAPAADPETITRTVAIVPAEKAAPAETEAAPATMPRPVRVAVAQARLGARGYDVGPATGQENPRTRLAVARYQEAEGLPKSGELDDATLQRLETAPAAPAEIAVLQEVLDELGYDPGGVDGVLGPGTQAALRDFQSDAGLEPTGTPDLATGAAIVRSVQERDQ